MQQAEAQAREARRQEAEEATDAERFNQQLAWWKKKEQEKRHQTWLSSMENLTNSVSAYPQPKNTTQPVQPTQPSIRQITYPEPSVAPALAPKRPLEFNIAQESEASSGRPTQRKKKTTIGQAPTQQSFDYAAAMAKTPPKPKGAPPQASAQPKASPATPLMVVASSPTNGQQSVISSKSSASSRSSKPSTSSTVQSSSSAGSGRSLAAPSSSGAISVRSSASSTPAAVAASSSSTGATEAQREARTMSAHTQAVQNIRTEAEVLNTHFAQYQLSRKPNIPREELSPVRIEIELVNAVKNGTLLPSEMDEYNDIMSDINFRRRDMAPGTPLYQSTTKADMLRLYRALYKRIKDIDR
jgi:hypothetical protein